MKSRSPFRIGCLFRESSVFTGDVLDCVFTIRNDHDVESTRHHHVFKSEYDIGLDDRKSVKETDCEVFLLTASVQGSFSVDENYVDSTAFNELKRDLVLPGGLVGQSVPQQYKFPLLSSLEHLWNGNESSLATLDELASGKSIPILSTPATILLASEKILPGDDVQKSFSLEIPLHLPPSHRGRLFRIHYNIVITFTASPFDTPRVLNIPFRVFQTLDRQGCSYIYDFLDPLIILRDPFTVSNLVLSRNQHEDLFHSSSEMTKDDFILYVTELLKQSQQGLPHRSPSSPGLNKESNGMFPVIPDAKLNPRDTIELIRQRGYLNMNPESKALKYNISHFGKHIAFLHLSKSVFRIGDVITGTLDFLGSALTTVQVCIV